MRIWNFFQKIDTCALCQGARHETLVQFARVWVLFQKKNPSYYVEEFVKRQPAAHEGEEDHANLELFFFRIQQNIYLSHQN